MKRRVVVTGLGVVTPIGIGVENFWQALLAGSNGVRPIEGFNPEGYPVCIAAEVLDFTVEDFISRKDARKMERFIHFAIAATDMAWQQAGLDRAAVDPDRIGVNIGSGIGGLWALEREHRNLLERGPRRVSPFFIPMMIINLASGQVAMRFNARGPNLANTTACATGAHSIGEAFHIIRRNDADVMICGGSEACVCPMCIAGFSSMRALSTRNHEPERASRPFDAERDGFVIGEGAGILVLESLEHAEARGAEILVEIAGYGASGDAYHLTAPDPEASGARRAIEAALRTGDTHPEEVDHINAHGTSTVLNDRLETMAIHQVFQDHAHELAIHSTKSMIGHLLGAAGGVEMVATVLSVKNGCVPPTRNYEYPDPDCDLDYTADGPRLMPIRAALCNSFGFGGTNASLLVRALV